ncbi:hypothetical protein [Enterovibrio baiacu]
MKAWISDLVVTATASLAVLKICAKSENNTWDLPISRYLTTG